MADPKVIAIKLVGGAYRRGFFHKGFGIVTLDNDHTIYVPDEQAKGFDGCLEYCEDRNVDTREMRERLDHWVKTGEWENAESQV